MKQPLGFVHGFGPVCKLRKTLYEIKHALRAWFVKLSSCLAHLRFIACQVDNSLFIMNTNVEYAIVLVYVDDMIIL